MVKNLTHLEKICLIKAVASGHIKPCEILPELSFVVFHHQDGTWEQLDNGVINVVNDDAKGYYEKLFPNNNVKLAIITFQDFCD